MTNKSSRSEKIVSGFAIAVLVAGLTTGVFAKPNHTASHSELRATHVLPAQAWQDD